MTKIELKKALERLSKYAQRARRDPVIVVKRGKSFAPVVPIRNADEETVSLSTNRKFLAIIERSRSRTKKEGAIPSKEIRRRLGLKNKSFRRFGNSRNVEVPPGTRTNGFPYHETVFFNHDHVSRTR